MDIKAMKERRATLVTEAERLANKENITKAEDTRLSNLLDAVTILDADIKRATDAVKASIVERASGVDEAPTYWKQTSRREVFEADSHDVRSKADMAKRAAEIVEKDHGYEVRREVSTHVERNSGYADYFRATANPDYASAWAKVITAGSEAAALLKMTDAERNAMARVAQAEARAMNEGTGSAGGLAVPVAVDAATIVLNNSGSVTNLRNLARIVTAVSDTWQGLASTGVTAAFVGEGVEVADNSPTLVGPTITAHKAAAFVPYSYELAMDWPEMLEAMRELLADSKERLEADKFLTGSGSGEPYGLITRLEANTAADVVVTTSGAIGAVDIYKIAADLPPRFRPNASWLSSMTVLNEIRTVSDDKLGNYVTDLRAGYNFSLLGRPVYEASDMDAMVDSTAAATFAVFGDIAKAYTVFDRLGSARIQTIPALVGASNRPTAQGGVLYWFRVGGDVLTGSTSGECGARILINKTS